MKSILIIEDDRKIAIPLTIRLKSAGYEATAAYDALTGLNAAVKNPPGPGAIGHQPARRQWLHPVRKNPNTPPRAHSHSFYYR